MNNLSIFIQFRAWSLEVFCAWHVSSAPHTYLRAQISWSTNFTRLCYISHLSKEIMNNMNLQQCNWIRIKEKEINLNVDRKLQWWCYKIIFQLINSSWTFLLSLSCKMLFKKIISLIEFLINGFLEITMNCMREREEGDGNVNRQTEEF